MSIFKAQIKMGRGRKNSVPRSEYIIICVLNISNIYGCWIFSYTHSTPELSTCQL